MFRTLLVTLALAFAPALLRAAAEEACSSCHDEQPKKIVGTVHADLGCSTCHTDHETYPHPKVAKPQCADCHQDVVRQHASSIHGQELRKGNAGAPDCSTCHNDVHEIKSAKSAEWRKSIPETCGMCHSEIAAQYNQSVHGKALAAGVMEAPVCTDCHGEHAIQKPTNAASPVHPSHIRETCGSCHGDVRVNRKFHMPTDRITSFEQSFHGLAAQAGNLTVANCASCHGVHNILASSDPKSTINARNLPQTCGQCHPGTSKRFTMGPVHFVEGRSEPPPVKFVRQLYLLLIPAVLGFMILHNGGDWLRKLIRRRMHETVPVVQPRVPHRQEIRMHGWERLQHALLLTSFITLTWTGFALKYPDSWWAAPFITWETHYPVRGTVHRIAAVIFMITAVIHVISIIVSPRLRRHWLNLLPRWRDITDTLHSFAYNLGLTNRKPHLPAYNFIEKMEYWAVVWGAVIMGATGIMLWANTFFLKYVPKVVLDVATAIHLYEAILAAAAIVVWHFYFVILDPDVYPVETTFLTGKSVRPHHDSDPATRRADHEPGQEPAQ